MTPTTEQARELWRELICGDPSLFRVLAADSFLPLCLERDALKAENDGPTAKWENKFSAESEKPVTMLEACGILECTNKARTAILAVEPQDFSE